jgi:hypothetical protein
MAETHLATGWIRLVAVAIIAGVAGFARANEPPRPAPDNAPHPATHYVIRGISAFPWYHDLGRFGQEDLLSGKVALWNVIIGEGGVAGAAKTTLVVVEVEGPSFLSSATGELVMAARTSRATLAERSVAFSSLFTEKHTAFAPLLLYGTGCEFVTVTATLQVNGKAVGTMTRTIEFRCGE